ncbi:MAG: hypothetical protein WAW07_00170, partial [Bacteroidales bacterium]
DWDNLLEDLKIDKIIFNVPRVAPVLYLSAIRHKISILLLFHTNKDIAAMQRPNFKYHAYGVWNQQMKEDLITKLPDANQDNVVIIGNSHYSYLAKVLPNTKREYFKIKYKIKKGTFLILYTAAAPFVIKNEAQYLKDIIDQMALRGMSNYRIILRKNPMDETDTLEKVFSQNKKVIIQTPMWYWNRNFNFNYTHYADLEEFSFLLESSNICINIPSSVTVEASIKHLPVINLCYLSEGVELQSSGKIQDFWMAPFYEAYHKYGFVFPTFCKEEVGIIIDQIYMRLKEPKGFEDCINETLGFKVKDIQTETVRFICTA